MTQQPNPQPPYKGLGLEDVRKLLDTKLVNTGVPGTMFGVGMTRAFDRDWQQCLAWIGAAASVWFLIKIGSRLAPRIDKAFDQAEKAADEKLELFQVNRDKFHDRYLEALKVRCVDLNVEGYGGLPRLALEDIYVSLRMHPGGRGNPTLQNRNLKIWDILPKANDPDQTFLARLAA
jgi:hypothetical protein